MQLSVSYKVWMTERAEHLLMNLQRRESGWRFVETASPKPSLLFGLVRYGVMQRLDSGQLTADSPLTSEDNSRLSSDVCEK